jgi:DNA-binding MarR family transcriptional regulator
MANADTDRKDHRDGLLGEVMMAVRAFTNAQDVFDDAAVRVLGINRSDGRCLDILDQSGPLTAGELARRADLSTAAITALVDRMERVGFLTRVRDTVDRRRVLIAGTEMAQCKCAAVWEPIQREGFAMLKRFSEDELATVKRFMDEGAEFLLSHLDRIKELAVDTSGQQAEPDGSPAELGKMPV